MRACRAPASRTARRRPAVVVSAAAADAASPTRVLIVGGTGRVGASAAWSLLTDSDRPGAYEVTLASRSRATFDQALKRRPQLAGAGAGGKPSAAASYTRADATDRASVEVRSTERRRISFSLAPRPLGPCQDGPR